MADKDNPFVVIDSFAQSYHWSLADISALSMGQLIMLTHGSSVNASRYTSKSRNAGTSDDGEERYQGKLLEDLDSTEYAKYLRS